MATAAPTDAQIAAYVEGILRARLPPGWELGLEREPRPEIGSTPDFVATLTASNGERVVYVGEAKREGSGSQLRTALEQLRKYVSALAGARPLFIAPWISEQTRDRLRSEDVSFVDATGNVRLTAERPGLHVTAEGAAKNPWPTDKALQSLRGKGTMRAVRSLLEFTPPYGVRELAGKSEASAPTLSRVIDLLEREGLLTRDDRGRVLDLDWAGTIRRWARDYDVLSTNDSESYLQPRGLSALTEALGSAKLVYALTGSLAAKELAPFAPSRLAMLYVDNLPEAAAALDCRPTDAGANVILLEPYDKVVYARTIERSGLRIVNPTQLAVDLLTGPGRAPSEGEELLTWMTDNTDVWRT
jgi:hypothetical protein